MGDDIPPEELNRAPKAGLDFGFPWYGGGDIRTQEYRDDTLPDGLMFPEIETPAHAANLGMIFYKGSKFPAKYRGGIFFAQHGSWNRTVPIGARVSFASLKPDETGEKAEVFAEGWIRKDGSYAGRPTDVAELPDGSLLVADDERALSIESHMKGKELPRRPSDLHLLVPHWALSAKREHLIVQAALDLNSLNGGGTVALKLSR